MYVQVNLLNNKQYSLSIECDYNTAETHDFQHWLERRYEPFITFAGCLTFMNVNER